MTHHRVMRDAWLGLALAAWLCLAGSAGAGTSGAVRRPTPPATPVLVFSTFESRGMGRLFRRILEEAYARIGYAVRFVEVPAERALVMSNQGRVDGEAGRVPVIEASCPNLIRVPTPLYTNRVVAYVRQGVNAPPRGSWDALADYRLGTVLGYKFVERKTEGLNRISVTDYAKLFTMLLHDRVDVAVVEYLDALPTVRALDAAQLRLLEPPLASNPMYHYLNRRHADLVPCIDGVLREMRAEGRMRALLDEMEAGLDDDASPQPAAGADR